MGAHSKTPAERRRMFELVVIVFVSILLIALSRLETQLFALSETLAQNQEFFTTILYFGLINFNVILILVLSFLIFRNVAKLLVERRRGVFGSRLRVKLVAALIVFALAPTILLTYVSARYIISSFDEWFSEKVRTSIQETREAGAQVYRQDQKRLESLARIGLQRLRLVPTSPSQFRDLTKIAVDDIEGFANQYGLDAIYIYDEHANLIGPEVERFEASLPNSLDILRTIGRFKKDPSLLSFSAVKGADKQDIVHGVAPIIHPITNKLIGIVVAETRFETQILRSIEGIQKTFSELRPSVQLIKLSYLILLLVMVLLILFSAVWLGFYVARGITGPIQSLADASREVALGNYRIRLTPKTEDEAGQLVRAFNQMTTDLERHRNEAEKSQIALLLSNEELEQRRRFMEVLMQNISTGVLSVDNSGRITSINSAGEALLSLDGAQCVGRTLTSVLGEKLYESLWQPILDGISSRDHWRGQVDLQDGGRNLALLVDVSRIKDENDADLGVVIVFDDATEKAKVERAAAWREVARRIAHEIKNPVTPIKLSAQRLLRRFGEAFEGEERRVFESCLHTILHQVDSLKNLVNEFSKFARLPTIRPSLDDVNQVIGEAVSLFRMSYPNIIFDLSGINEIPKFPLDRDQMNRAFVNLIANAVGAINEQTEQPRIAIRTTLLADMYTLRIEVIDNGCGIPEELRDRVMEPYYSTKEEGSGLGLAIVNQIVADHGGYLRLLPNEPTGTKVIVEVPIDRDKKPQV